jgi:hypothetical protein
MNTPINIEAPSPDNVDYITIQKAPMNGQLTTHPNNTVTYTPNNGFVGFDEFVIEFCYKDLQCDTMAVEVEVIPGNNEMSTVPGDNQTNVPSEGSFVELSTMVWTPLIALLAAFLSL